LIITCLWRSLYFFSVGPTVRIASVRRLRGLLTTGPVPPHQNS